MGNIKRSVQRALAALVAALTAAQVSAATNSSVASALTDVEDTWNAILPIMVAIGVFSIGWAFVKRIKRA